MEYWLPVIWFGVIGFGVLMYVLLDGFVLGLGILAPFAEDEAQLDHMMNTAAPIWDGNETWLVMGGAGLLAAFPKAYAVVLSALYLPVLLMLIALIFRGVAFEFRFKAVRAKRAWGAAFALGSMAAAFSQGVILGALVDGLPLQGGQYLGGIFGWFSPFSMLTGIAVMFGYALLGSSWLILKTEGRMQLVARTLTRPLVLVVVAFMGLVSAWLPFLDSRIMARWFDEGNFWWLAPVPLLALVNAVLLWRAVMHQGRDVAPFLLTLC
ncbi:MAG: cytochrome d ubiquinol oxidase subunit II, partial [Pseudomonadota bacterium]|nr:cytochrome d ubiquinol oxidase subunit II [Pseudomonadota bacterium]